MSGADYGPLRQLSLFRPYPDAVPWSLFEAAQLDDAQLAWLEERVAEAVREEPSVHLRVAKLEEQAVGAYLLQQSPGYAFRLVYLQVDSAWQKRGIGRWILGHALGLAESKGGRSLAAVSCSALTRFLRSYGFVEREGDGLSYPFTPE
ncbi:MAG: GNAT family N-acetyltransferase [Pseudomonadota bacterium]